MNNLEEAELHRDDAKVETDLPLANILNGHAIATALLAIAEEQALTNQHLANLLINQPFGKIAEQLEKMNASKQEIYDQGYDAGIENLEAEIEYATKGMDK